MFLASMYARTQPYSTRQAAERELATHIRKVMQGHVFFPNLREKIGFMCAQEKYSEVIETWNKFVTIQLHFNSLHMAEVVEMPLDQPFK